MTTSLHSQKNSHAQVPFPCQRLRFVNSSGGSRYKGIQDRQMYAHHQWSLDFNHLLHGVLIWENEKVCILQVEIIMW